MHLYNLEKFNNKTKHFDFYRWLEKKEIIESLERFGVKNVFTINNAIYFNRFGKLYRIIPNEK